MFVYIYIHMFVYIYVCIYIFMNTCIHMYVYNIYIGKSSCLSSMNGQLSMAMLEKQKVNPDKLMGIRIPNE